MELQAILIPLNNTAITLFNQLAESMRNIANYRHKICYVRKVRRVLQKHEENEFYKNMKKMSALPCNLPQYPKWG
jgi:hypothetical protein